MSADLDELRRRAALEQGIPGTKSGLFPEAESGFRDIQFELESAYHRIMTGDTYVQRFAAAEAFIQQGLGFLRTKESEFVEEVEEWWHDQDLVPRIIPSPTSGALDELPQYELRLNLRGGTTAVIYAQDYQSAREALLEDISHEFLANLLPWVARVAEKLVEHEVLDFKPEAFRPLGIESPPRTRVPAPRMEHIRRFVEKDKEEPRE